METHCQLPFPDKFTEAAAYVAQHGESLSEESKLLLYSLHQQATVGPCNEPKPWGWSVVNNAKWQSWKQLPQAPATRQPAETAMTASNIGRHALGFFIGSVLGSAVYAYLHPDHWAAETGLHIRFQPMRRTPANWPPQVQPAAPTAAQQPQRWTDPGQSA
jgi:acyl-CoA-binding protein